MHQELRAIQPSCMANMDLRSSRMFTHSPTCWILLCIPREKSKSNFVPNKINKKQQKHEEQKIAQPRRPTSRSRLERFSERLLSLIRFEGGGEPHTLIVLHVNSWLYYKASEPI